MELKLKGASIPCWNEVFSQTLRREAVQEAIVPDTMPDVGSIVTASGTVLIRGKDVGEGRVRIEANLPVKITCADAAGEGLFLQEMDLPLSLSAEDPAIPEGAPCMAEFSLATLEAKAPNPRKLAVRAEVVCRLRCFSQGQISLPGLPEETEEGVHIREKELTLTRIAAVTEKTFILTDEFSLPEGEEKALTVLESQLALETGEARTVGSKLVVKGRARSSLTCLAESGELIPLEVSTEFSQVLEAEGMPEAPQAEVSVIPSGVYYEISGDGRTGSLELHLVAQAAVLGDAAFRCAVDAYSNAAPVEPDRERIEVRRVLRPVSLRETATERFSLPQPADTVISASVTPGLAAQEGPALRLPLTVSACYRTAEGELRAFRGSAALRFGGDLGGDCTLEPAAVSLQEFSLTPSGSGLELRAAAELRGLLWEREALDCISALRRESGERGEAAAWPSLVLLRAGDGTDLWELAKENHSTVECIREANRLDEETAPWEKLLLIPRQM